ncbi:stalk domain-containing protein [Natranaerofaba carboxydovora]|uniref:stalk domain-containing protein n=1 Tax=Natranaerofaba carboxydovora TaxID=2742683 RepID=UPI001F147393|nr:glycosyl hydrolase family 18 protein [Natranaerofaba carboxydovora]
MILLILSINFFGLMPENVFAVNNEVMPGPDVYLSDQKVVFDDVKPKLINDRTFLPFRKVAELTDTEVEWKGEERKVEAVKDELKLVMEIDNPNVILNRQEKLLDEDEHARIIDDRTMVPLRFFAESFNMNVEYEDGIVYLSPIADEKVGVEGEVYGFYALGGSWNELFGEDYPELGENHRLDTYDTIGVGWYELDKEGNLVTDGNYGFSRPGGYERVLEYAFDEEYNLAVEMMVFKMETKDKDLSSIILSEEKRKEAAKQIILEAENYSGVNLDLEGLGFFSDEDEVTEVQNKFTAFVEEIKEGLDEEKSLTITLHPPNSVYSDAYDFEQLGKLADQVVIMAYDYNEINTPGASAPYPKVKEAVEKSVELIDNDKIILGVRTPAVKYSNVINEKVEDENDINLEETEDREIVKELKEDDEISWRIRHIFLDSVYDLVDEKKEEIDGFDVLWDEDSKVNYVRWEEDGIENYIYYKTDESLNYKLDLIGDYNLKGLAIWRIGLVPEVIYDELDDFFKR